MVKGLFISCFLDVISPLMEQLYEIAKDANADSSKSPILTTNYKGAGLLDLIRVLRTLD